MNVIMFHSIGNENSSWCQNWLSVSFAHFEQFCRYLHDKRYHTIFLEDWYKLHNHKSFIDKKHIVLTFDDGYLDNWVYVYPLLKKYGLKGTIFVNPEFVDPSDIIRHNLEDVWSGISNYASLKTLGYLSWNEIQHMDQSGVIDIQSHGMSHNYYYKSDTLINYYTGQDKYHWLAWNEKPERKHLWLNEDQKFFISFGYPVFEYGRALGIRRFIPSERYVNSFISKYKELEYDNNINPQRRLIDYTKYFKLKYSSLGRYETDEEMEKRYRYEIYESKNMLEEKLSKKINYICWPGGGYNDLSIRMSIEAGYKASTVASWDNHFQVDNIAQYKRIRRFGLGSFISVNNKKIYVKNRNHLVHSLLSRDGNIYYIALYRLKKYINHYRVLRIFFKYD
jgi:peptidoglycan/xylan/chitin deacetylase (PgdA/CDA1 family)